MWVDAPAQAVSGRGRLDAYYLEVGGPRAGPRRAAARDMVRSVKRTVTLLACWSLVVAGCDKKKSERAAAGDPAGDWGAGSARLAAGPQTGPAARPTGPAATG